MKTNPIFKNIASKKLLLGMVHLPPLPGAHGATGLSTSQVMERALEIAIGDGRALVEGGMDGFIVENFGDAPFFPENVPPITIAAVSALCNSLVRELRPAPGRSDSPPIIGVNVLRNDAAAALAIASAVDLDFIRVNIHCGAMVTDQGIIEGQAFKTLRERGRLNSRVSILADVLVKHAAPLAGAEQDPGNLAREIAYRGAADGLIVTGDATGSVTDLETLRKVKEAVPDRPILVGSGIHVDNIAEYIEDADGFIVGTALKRDGKLSNPVDPERVRRLVEKIRKK